MRFKAENGKFKFEKPQQLDLMGNLAGAGERSEKTEYKIKTQGEFFKYEGMYKRHKTEEEEEGGAAS